MPRSSPLSAVPGEVLASLGPSPRDLSRLGSSRVLQANGLVLKTGPPDRAAREAFVLGALAGSLPLGLPTLVDAGPSWMLLRSVDVVQGGDPALGRASALADLAGLHGALADKPVLADSRLRDVTGRERPALLERSVRLAARLDLPEPLGRLAADPAPLLAELAGETTLVHGDAWPGNILATANGERIWIDWEEAGAGHSAIDLATWLHGSPWVPPSPDPDGDLAVYLAARSTPAGGAGFRRAVDAAVVLLFLLLDLPGIAGRQEAERRHITDRRAIAARRFVG